MRAWHAPALCLALLLAGCPSLQGPRPLPLRPVAGEEERIARWIRAARARGEGRRSLRAFGRIRIESPEGRGSWREVVLVERPDRLRLETLGMLGQAQALLVSNGDAYTFYDGAEIERGAAYDGVLRDRLGFDIDTGDAIAVLLAAPVIAGESPLQIFAEGEGRVVELEMQRVRFDPDGRLAGVDQLDANGETVWSAAYGAYAETVSEARGETTVFPMELALAFPRAGLRVSLEFQEVALDPDLDPSVFDVSP